MKKSVSKHATQINEYKITAFRLGTLILSMGTLLAFGYALSGLGGYLFGKGSPPFIAGGLFSGILSAWGALKLWKRYLNLLHLHGEETPQQTPTNQEND